MAMKKPENITFETAMQELEAIIEGLDKGNIPLEEFLKHVERGIALNTHNKKSNASVKRIQSAIDYL